MNSSAPEKRQGCGMRLIIGLVLVGLFVWGLVLGVVQKATKVPVISLAAEDIPAPLSQIFLVVGLITMCLFAIWMFLLGQKWALVLPVVLLVECAFFWGRPIPNTLPSTWLTMFILILIGVLYYRALRKGGPLSKFQATMESLGEGMLGFMKSAVGEKARDFFPLVATFFLFITLSNWCGILPGFGSVGVYVEHHAEEYVEEAAAAEEHSEEAAVVEEHGEEEHEKELVPFFRSANAHLSTTLALAFFSVVTAQYFGFKMQGTSYLDKYLNFRASSPKPDPATQQGLQGTVSKVARVVEIGINGSVGLLEILLEALKVLPFSFRLFGNIFAGEVLLFVVSSLFVFVFPIIFLGLELFVGLIQGLIFAMLTLVFFSIATTSHHSDESHH